MPDLLYTSDLSPFGTRLRLVSAFTGRALPEASPPGGSGSDAMKAISHFGRIPAIVRDDRVLIESAPLMEYLVETAGGSSLMPDTPADRAAVRGLISAHDHDVLDAYWPAFLQLRTGKPDPAIVVPALVAGGANYAVLTRLMDGDGSYALGGRITLADLAIAPFAFLFGRLNPMFGQATPFVEQPRLASWWAAVSAVSQVATVIAAMDAAFTRAFVR